MIQREDIELLCSAPLRSAIEANLGRNPSDVALDRGVPHSSLVATQVKYLQRAERKLPRMYKARCIIPPRAFEQCSSEECAERKPICGDSVLDLTCGLGVDAMALAARFRRVVALERCGELAEVVRHNFKLLGIDNVEVINSSAEEYLAQCNERFDWVYADPDRRSDTGHKMVCLEDCSPNILALKSDLERVTGRVALKLSPLFDCEEALRLFPSSEVEVVSWGGECKEVNILTNAPHPLLRTVVVGVGEWTFKPEDIGATMHNESFQSGEWQYMIIPDVALHKGRVAVAALRDYASLWSNNGYGFMCTLPEVLLPGRVYAIESIEEYRPKELKRKYKGIGADIMKRDTSLTTDVVRRALGLKAGSEMLCAVTTIESRNWFIRLRK